MLKTSSRHVTNKCLLGWFLVYWSFKRQPHKVVKHTQKIRWLLTFCFVYLYLVCCDKPFFELSLSKTSFGWIWPTIVIKNCLCFRCLWKISSIEMLFQITLGIFYVFSTVSYYFRLAVKSYSSNLLLFANNPTTNENNFNEFIFSI